MKGTIIIKRVIEFNASINVTNMLQYYRTMLLWKNLSEYLKLEKGFYARKRTETIKRKAKRRWR